MTEIDLSRSLIAEGLQRTAPVNPAGLAPLPRGFLRGIVLKRLQTLGLPIDIREQGVLVMTSGARAPLHVEIHDPRCWAAVAFDGTNGAGDAYAEGWWDVDDLTGMVRLLTRHAQAMAALDSGLGQLIMPLFRLAHRARRNTRDGAKENIHAHYDLGNGFFSRWLDPTMTYSSAWYSSPEQSLEQAQIAKIDLLLDRVELQAGEHVVEIGTGWGELALRAAARGARVTTVTISEEQHRLATQRVAEAGLTDRITVRLCDYRDLEGTYDKLVSVEMVEAVGREYYPDYFKTLARLLKPGGLAAIQAITIREQEFERAAKEADFIKRRIFPGCCIPSVEALLTAMRKHSDLNLISLQDFGAHYAKTLETWRSALKLRAEELRGLGYDTRFQRLWEFYLSYCAGGFAERVLGVSHLVFAKPGWRAHDHAALIGKASWDA